MKYVYNFIFPDGCNQLSIGGYLFKRSDEYIKSVQSLQHLISSFDEFDQPINTGTHAVTARVDLPSREKKPVIEWGNKKATALDDILLLLSIFTHRDVFAFDEPITAGKGAITADSREYLFGLRSAIKYENDTNKSGYQYDIGFQKDIDKVYRMMRSSSWKKEYGRGRFLPLFRSACRRQILETSFITCWTIWEILFTLHNKSWLSDDQIIKLPASEKISFVITRYQIKKDAKDRKGIKRFVKIRNKLVHAGRFLDPGAIDDGALFVHVTAIIIARILGLPISSDLGFQEQLLSRIRGQEIVHIERKRFKS